mmetsp:Transcript_34417/g.97519  ORF Transcript_34417/g.97519 Transcript_34417/m.97519 type:complete len:243 (-) Transcript_34417:192-920(-)
MPQPSWPRTQGNRAVEQLAAHDRASVSVGQMEAHSIRIRASPDLGVSTTTSTTVRPACGLKATAALQRTGCPWVEPSRLPGTTPAAAAADPGPGPAWPAALSGADGVVAGIWRGSMIAAEIKISHDTGQTLPPRVGFLGPRSASTPNLSVQVDCHSPAAWSLSIYTVRTATDSRLSTLQTSGHSFSLDSSLSRVLFRTRVNPCTRGWALRGRVFRFFSNPREKVGRKSVAGCALCQWLTEQG